MCPEQTIPITVPVNRLKNIKTLLFLFLCLRITLTTYAGDFLFTSVNTSQGLSDNQIRFILQLPDGRMVFTTSGSVNLYDGAHFTYLHRTAEDVYPLRQYDGYYRIYRSGDSLLWIKDYHKLMCIDLYKERYITALFSYFHDEQISLPLKDLFVDDQGRTWLLLSDALQELGSGIRVPLPDNDFRKLQDVDAKDDALYLFYDTGEVVCYDLRNQKESYTASAYPPSEQEDFWRTSLVVKGSKGFYQLRNGRKGGLFYFNWQNRTWKKIFEQDYTLNTLVVLPGDEKAYISCVHGFWIIDLLNGAHQYLPLLQTRKGQIVSTEISTVFQDFQGGLWAGTLNRGLLYYHPAMHKLAYIGRSSFPVPIEEDVSVECFTEDKAGNIYLKNHSHIYRLSDNKDGSLSLVPVIAAPGPSELSAPLQRSAVNYRFRDKNYTALCTDSRGWTWAGTSDGLELFTDNEQAPRIFYCENGLSNNFVQAILEDRNNDIWVTTSNGISRIHVNPHSQDISFTNFNRQDGALEGEYIQGSIFESSDGTLYFGGIDGFNVFRPDHEPIAPGLPYTPVFTALRLYGKKVNIGEMYGNRIILPQTPPYTKSIELDYNQNFLTFEFSALNYLNGERTYYRYRLEGVDKDWNHVFVGGQNGKTDGASTLQASYTDLSPGKYTFRVMASDNILQWDGRVTEVSLIIHAPWWKTTTAYTLYIIALLLVTIAGIRLYVYWTRKKMERRHKEEILLLRIRNLIEQCNSYEAEQKARSEENNVPSACEVAETSHVSKQDAAESAFLARAIEQVEKNLHVSGYSVEQLSRDLCMERTGLYRKLVTMLDQSPSLFIRNIRLRRAAQLLAEGNLSIAEIAECTGFSSSSYLSKCFQEMYGCRPSEYAEKMKKST